MSTHIRLGRLARVAACLAASFSAACGGGGSSSGDFELLSISVPANGTWQVNRPMLFVFSQPVDFSTVNLNTITIAQTSGIPASGEFSLVDPTTVEFQPRCPTVDDYSDAGLLPGGVQYTIKILASTQGGPSVRSTSGAGLSASQTLSFSTPTGSDPALLFLDTALGPPAPVIRTDVSVVDASYLELSDDPNSRVYFQPRSPVDPDYGADTPAGFASGLNLYSDVSTHISALVAINQAVDPSSSNIDVDTVRLEYETGIGTWENVAHTVDLVANCIGTGALLRVTPTGILPQNHFVRIRLTRDFEDLVGDGNLVDVVVGTFLVTTATNPGTPTPGAEGDEIFDDFSVGGSGPNSLEDTTSVLSDPRAVWGQGGVLEAGFAFDGTGGPGGDFDWKVGNDLPPSTSNHPQVLLDTTFSVITNEQQTAQQTVINGLVDVRDLWVTASGTLLIQGPNACTILASGTVRIDGEITLEGNNNRSVATLNTTNQPEVGASGKAGGGKGGAGSPLTTQSSPAGESGYGAFNATGGGGVGGESAVFPGWPGGTDQNRRPAGGGGGSLGPTFLRPMHIHAGQPHGDPNYLNPNLCPDQERIGYDGEKGFPGHEAARGVLSNSFPPQGGDPGPRPFLDSDPNNDFWGTMRTQSGQLVLGELPSLWAGAGGGGGGNAIVSNSFPTTPFSNSGDEKGAGGGGAGGGLTILALGDITFGPRGRINAGGGTGGGGENSLSTGGVTHIGGGSGGGSGGHIVLQTASQIDLSAVVTSVGPGLALGGISVLGGQGGAGRNNAGGATPGGFPTTPQNDALPPNSYPHTTAPCGVVSGAAGYLINNFIGNATPLEVVECAGGDGTPGLIQLHTPTLADIIVPTGAGENVYTVCRPPPVGSWPFVGLPDFNVINDPTGTVGLPTAPWNQLLPIFGRKSQAISKWISLGSASVSPTVANVTPELVELTFEGTSALGVIQTSGGQVNDLPPILNGIIAAGPTPPFIAADQRTVVFDGTTITDDIYLRNPALLRRFVLRMATTNFEIGSATYDPASANHELRLTVTASGMPLGIFPAGTTVQVIPRFFRVITEGVANALPASSRIVIEFQATTQTAQGDPDTSPTAVSLWEPDLFALSPNRGNNPDYRFIRFRIGFDISATGAPLSFDTPIPSLDFFRVRFKF